MKNKADDQVSKILCQVSITARGHRAMQARGMWNTGREMRRQESCIQKHDGVKCLSLDNMTLNQIVLVRSATCKCLSTITPCWLLSQHCNICDSLAYIFTISSFVNIMSSWRPMLHLIQCLAPVNCWTQCLESSGCHNLDGRMDGWMLLGVLLRTLQVLELCVFTYMFTSAAMCIFLFLSQWLPGQGRECGRCWEDTRHESIFLTPPR